MPSLNQGQVGHRKSPEKPGELRSMPKITRINGDDHAKVIYRNLGNNHAYPFVWASTAVLPAGDDTVLLASGIKWHGYELASYSTVVATAEGAVTDLYIEKDKDNNMVYLKSTAGNTTGADVDVALMFMLGGEMEVDGLFCRGAQHSPAQMLP